MRQIGIGVRHWRSLRRPTRPPPASHFWAGQTYDQS